MSTWTNWPASFTLSFEQGFARDFPNLLPSSCEGPVSIATRSYNCFAWAASIITDRWEPDPLDQYYWPDNVPRDYSLSAFIEAYRTVGFELCSDASLEPGFEKIAIYTVMGQPQHAARQLENGHWSTKFGDFEDVVHVDLECLIGPVYGRAEKYMRRVRG